jgi:hypothetical protein
VMPSDCLRRANNPHHCVQLHSDIGTCSRAFVHFVKYDIMRRSDKLLGYGM